MYLGLNIMGVILYSIEMKFKLEKPPYVYLKYPMMFWPIVIFFFIIWILVIRSDISVKVCLCDYKQDVTAVLGYNYESLDHYQGGYQFYLSGYPSS